MDRVCANLGEEGFDALLSKVHSIGKSVLAKYADDVDREARFPDEAFAAFRAEKLLSTYIPQRFGGMGCTITQICGLCEAMGQYCASTAMIYAMHQIQVACIVHHGQDNRYFSNYLKEIVDRQILLASATTEMGVGGDVRSSVCAVNVTGDRFELNKQAPVISYALSSDAVMVTCRRNDEASANDQSLVLVKRDDCTLTQIAGWDTLGFRGTCSLGFSLESTGHKDQIFPVPYAQVLAKSMHPVSHLLWGSLWTGIASSAVEVARRTVRAAARKSPQVPPVTALRLSEVNEILFSMRSGLYQSISEYERLLAQQSDAEFSNYGFSIRTNNVKIRCSEMVIDIVGKALQIVGISGYKNDGENSLGRHLRDAYGASLMVNNDRIRGHNATMQIAYKGT